uniref:Uncharacterized protein n=1 Tax=Tanacetum cinerariifolium TaxID=118510 RepID=A0A6L2KBA3_TANCI|nr:hypothetical protein [Tanacetum cinerariifolium]
MFELGSDGVSGEGCWVVVKSQENRGEVVLPRLGCDRLVIRAKVIENQIMAASAISISFDSSYESVGSLPSWVILFGDIPTVIPSTPVIAQETSTIALVISYDSYSDLPDEMASPEYITSLPATLPFLFTDSSEDFDPSEASDSFEAPPSQDPYVTNVARLRSRVTTCSSSPSDFPIAPVTTPPGTRQRAVK